MVIDPRMVDQRAADRLCTKRGACSTPHLVLALVLLALLPAWLLCALQPLRTAAWRARSRCATLAAAARRLAAGGRACWPASSRWPRPCATTRAALPDQPAEHAVRAGRSGAPAASARARRLAAARRRTPRWPAAAGRSRRCWCWCWARPAAAATSASTATRATPRPNSRAQDVASFRNAWSCGTSTAASVPCMFSHLGRERFDGRTSEYENLLDVLQHAGLAVLWIDNQPAARACATACPPSNTAGRTTRSCAPAANAWTASCCEGLDAAHRRAAGRAPRARRGAGDAPDGQPRAGLLPALAAGVQALPARVHQRRPAGLQPRELVNAYDNTIAYTDHVLAGAIDWLQAQQARYDTGACSTWPTMANRWARTTCTCTACPTPWRPTCRSTCRGSPGCRPASAAHAASRWTACVRAPTTRLTHDQLFHSVLGLMQVRTTAYRPALDAYAPCAAS